MRVYVDTEFNGFGGQLLSMALAAEDGREFYEVMPLPARIDPWVRVNVLPKLERAPLLSQQEFRFRLHGFLAEIARDEAPEFIADWHRDLEFLLAGFAGADYGTSLDYPCRLTLLKTPPGEPRPVNPHNALSDARALRDWHRSL